MSIDFQVPPWWKTGPDDYTRSRSADVTYTVDDLIGRHDAKKYTLSIDDPTTISGIEGMILI